MLYVENNNNKMDSFELNKIIAAILMVALLVIGLGKIADVAFHVIKPKLIIRIISISRDQSERLSEGSPCGHDKKIAKEEAPESVAEKRIM